MRASLVLTLVLPLSLASCGGDDGTPDDSGIHPDGGVVADAEAPDVSLPDAMPADATPCVTLGGVVNQDVPGEPNFMNLPPNIGVTVTAYVGTTVIDTTETATDGGFGLCVPPDADVVVRIQKAGFASYAFLMVTGAPGGRYLAVRHFHDSYADAFWGSLGGATYPSATSGFMTMSTWVNPTTFGLAGVSVAISPAPAGGPYYFDATYTYQPTLTQTTSAGVMAAANIANGMTTLQLNHSTLTCHQLNNGFAGPNPESMQIPIFANTETLVDVTCD